VNGASITQVSERCKSIIIFLVFKYGQVSTSETSFPDTDVPHIHEMSGNYRLRMRRRWPPFSETQMICQIFFFIFYFGEPIKIIKFTHLLQFQYFEFP